MSDEEDSRQEEFELAIEGVRDAWHELTPLLSCSRDGGMFRDVYAFALDTFEHLLEQIEELGAAPLDKEKP